MRCRNSYQLVATYCLLGRLFIVWKMLETLVILDSQLLVFFHGGGAGGIGTHNLVVVVRQTWLFTRLGVDEVIDLFFSCKDT